MANKRQPRNDSIMPPAGPVRVNGKVPIKSKGKASEKLGTGTASDAAKVLEAAPERVKRRYGKGGQLGKYGI